MGRKKKNRMFLLKSLEIDTKKYKGLPSWADFVDPKKKLVDKVISCSPENRKKKK